MSEIESMKQQLAGLEAEALAAIAAAADLAALEALRVHYLGKKGGLTEVLKGVGKLPPEQRPLIGQVVNDTKNALGEAFEAAAARLQ
ncbi:MAG TPA: phenylalanine--tRNA ligase subunit alpha, partial [Mariprofundaceae bacterium]|nr:phenylalanine--tRNA ligase subunit alpha [Mariprofundaceae bacterium]